MLHKKPCLEKPEKKKEVHVFTLDIFLWRDFENAEIICLLSEKWLQHKSVSFIYSYEASIMGTWQRKLITVCWELGKPSDRRVSKADPEGHVEGQKEILEKRCKEPI